VSVASAQIINIPDTNFKAKLLASATNNVALDNEGATIVVDANSNGEIEVAEALSVYWLVVNGSNIADLTGIEHFTNLTHLLAYNNAISVLDVSMLPNLQVLTCQQNELVSLNVAGLANLTNVVCWANDLSILDFSGCESLTWLNCSSNQLTTLILKNGSIESNYDFTGNPSLSYICVDDAQLQAMQNLINVMPYLSCEVNSYCTFTPGGNYHTLNGGTRLDLDDDGCTTADIPFPHLKFNVMNGTVASQYISNTSGNYSIPLTGGEYVVTPIIENPGYFTISPQSVPVSFTGAGSNVVQNFCVSANETHNDLEITLVPTSVARPGFDAEYKLVYKNKGNTIQSGEVTLTFEDIFVDFMFAMPTVNSQTENTLTWNYSNLQPFETREIDVRLNVNSPTETPSVNAGDQLNFLATVYPHIGDELPLDNGSGLKQIVVNSFDPNDKTCLEGTTISPEMVGQYVHYVIRFENTGTFPAENIVVKDMIDASKFNIATLIPLSGSHSFETRIKGNKVEFMFENIMLPFEDASNDGYVAFKIKTLPTLTVGTTFQNSASIYFDYNFPIITDPAVTTIQTLGKADFDFSRYFTLYPNPVKDVLRVKAAAGIMVTSYELYDVSGQLVMAIPNAEATFAIDVSQLKTGIYFLKINSDKGTTNAKFVRN
jgi:hypothetical protein